MLLNYSPSISTTAYQPVIPSMGESVVSDFIKKYGRTYRGGDFVETEHADFDLLIVHEEAVLDWAGVCNNERGNL